MQELTELGEVAVPHDHGVLLLLQCVGNEYLAVGLGCNELFVQEDSGVCTFTDLFVVVQNGGFVASDR